MTELHHSSVSPGPEYFATVARFQDSRSLLTAAARSYEQGFRKLDAYTPIPVEGLSEALGQHSRALPRMVLIAGLLGCAGGFGLLYWIAVIAYPHNVGGRPLNSWPAFIPITFECTILLAALTAVFGMLGLNGLPQPYHPVFNTPGFRHASLDGFFLSIEAADSRWDPDETREFLLDLGAREVTHVPR